MNTSHYIQILPLYAASFSASAASVATDGFCRTLRDYINRLYAASFSASAASVATDGFCRTLRIGSR